MKHYLTWLLHVGLVTVVAVGATVAVFALLVAMSVYYPWIRRHGFSAPRTVVLAIVFGGLPTVWGLNSVLAKLRYPLPSYRSQGRGFDVSR